MRPRFGTGRILRIELDPAASSPLYRQLSERLRALIVDGTLPADAPLPSTRVLAREVSVSRSTVILAYEQLRAEGYVTGAQGTATRVRRGVVPAAPRAEPRPAAPARTFAGTASRRAAAAAAIPFAAMHVVARAPRAFRAGTPAVDVFPVELWGRLLARRWRRTSPRMLAYGDPMGYEPLRVAVAQYLAAARGVRCEPAQVMITSGSQQAVDLVSRTVLDAGDAAWLEDPGYFAAHGALALAGAHVVPVPVDDEGLDVDAGRRLRADPRLVFVTPSRQLPTGAVMSARRRAALLDFAASAGAWVFEDDYDSEFRYASQPLSALQGLDAHGCVIYAGTFSKVMFPAMRLGYVVLPPPLVEVVRAARVFQDYHSPQLEQAVMADFLAEGHFERHIRRMRTIYQERQAALLASAARHLAAWLDVRPADAGLTVQAWLRRDWDDVAVARAAAAAGVDVLPMSVFCLARRLPPGLLLGYSGVGISEIEEGAERLAHVLARLEREGNGERRAAR